MRQAEQNQNQFFQQLHDVATLILRFSTWQWSAHEPENFGNKQRVVTKPVLQADRGERGVNREIRFFL